MKVICFGDSLTSCGGVDGRYSDILQQRFPAHSIINRGVGGETFVEGAARFETDVLAERPDVVLIELGANDWWRDERPPQAWASDLENMVTRVREGGAQPVVLGVFGPCLDDDGREFPKVYGTDDRAESFRAMEEAVAERAGCTYLSNIQQRIVGRRTCWRDRNHPNEFGNRYVADEIEPVLERLLGDAPLPLRKPGLRTTHDMWLEAVALAPDRIAAVDGDRSDTFSAANEIAARVAGGLADITRGEAPRVAVYLPNCLEYFRLYWAVQRIGGVIIPLNTWLRGDGLEAILKHVQPHVLVVESAKAAVPLKAVSAVPSCAIVSLAGDTGIAWEKLAAGEPAAARSIPDDTVSIIMHTSGTTGVPKGAVMRHSDLIYNVMTTINAHDFGPADTHLLVNPMFHATALYSSIPTAAYTKTKVVISASTRPADLLRLVEREKITTFLSVPPVFQQVLNVTDLARYDLSSLRLMAYAGSPMPAHVVGRLRAQFPDVALHNFFGLTETISMTHVLRGDEAEARPDSIGRLLPFVDAVVVDEDGTVVPPGEVGELLFARHNVIAEYYGQSGRLEEAFVSRDGCPWFDTGDLACVDDEGYFFIKGRRKDMIIVGGENVYAVEVEATLGRHPAVKEAAVTGVPATGAASFLGERVKAYVVLSDDGVDEAELRKFCFEHLPSYKVPYAVAFLDALPRNPAGKVVKSELPA